MTKPSHSVLERRVYGVADAAGLLGQRPDCVRAWLDGSVRRGFAHAPIIRDQRTEDDVVTWGEFVELGYLRTCRRRGVPLRRLRTFLVELRREFETPHPLAAAQPYVEGHELVLEVQERTKLPSALAMVIRSSQGTMLAGPARRFFMKLEFDSIGHAHRLRPAGAAVPVVIDPLVGFGRPSVSGVATERLWELFDAGESVDEISVGYELEPNLVRAAVAYEEQLLRWRRR